MADVRARAALAGDGVAGAQGILEGAACGFAGAVLVLLPGVVTTPLHAAPYVLGYGGLAAVLGLAVGAVLWISATLTLRLCAWACTLHAAFEFLMG